MIEKIGVLGAGSMGAAVAALAASAGLEVILLDVKGQDDPAGPARRGLERAAKQRAFLDPSAIERVRVGNVEDDLGLLADCDWVLEAIIENREAKRDLFRRLHSVLPPQTIVTTNTSTFTLHQLLPEELANWRERFFVTHFFNPPRALLLCEVTAFPEGETERFHGFVRFLEQRLGRRVLLVRDTPGFVANRFGIYALVHAVRLTGELGLAPEDVDALTGPLLGRPRSATFRTIDLTGLDILVLGTRSLQESTGDDYAVPDWILDLYQANRLGDKTGGGIFRREGDQQLTYDPIQRADRPSRPPAIPGLEELLRQPFPQRLLGALELPSPYGDYVRQLLGRTFGYVLLRTKDAARDIASVDRALEWGFGWAAGPYAQMQFLGIPRVRQLVAEAGLPADGLLDLAERRGGFFVDGHVLDPATGELVPEEQLPSTRRTQQIRTREALDHEGLRELGDGVVAVRIRSLTSLAETLERALARWPSAVVLVPAFEGLGYPYGELLELAEAGNWPELEARLEQLQQTLQTLSELPIPVVTALDGEARGAATTLALWSDATVAYLTAATGYPGATAGLLPLGAATALRLRSEVRERTLAAPLRAELSTARALTALLAAERVDSAARAGALGLLGDLWLATADRDGLLDAAAGIARALARSVPARPFALSEALAEAGETLAAGPKLAQLEPAARRVVETLARALRRAGTLADLLVAERNAALEVLQQADLRSQASATLQALTAPRR
ncbi:MAG: 3-hydroxyacyl-CoA dehydrogenase NAD-binding domain-containing protein [Thermomicrobium sp.]|nr:3-hydroxyacyl-CoA dehydrogenase NAD-binding domain-containing protein [Thermomicrobium sp.]MDW8007260.1 3-hydroxyacyl-CoA dehydrogenase NAD-binding domain-containing protein [Thermomicrobium sp.]